MRTAPHMFFLTAVLLVSAVAAQNGSLRQFGKGCSVGRGGPPRLGFTGLLKPGNKVTFKVDGALPNSAVLLVFGASTKRWGPFTLPLDLGFIGAPKCIVYTSLDSCATTRADGAGHAKIAVTVPNKAKLVGKTFCCQWAVLAPRANRLGIAVSAAGVGTIIRR